MIKTVEFATARQVADHMTLLLALKRQFSCHYSDGFYSVSYPLADSEQLVRRSTTSTSPAQERWTKALVDDAELPGEDGP